MNEEITITTEVDEEALPCFVRHPDAGGPCWEPATVEVYGLGFCERHGREVRLGADLEAYQDAEWFVQRLRNPEVPEQSPAIEEVLGCALDRLREGYPSDEDYWEALKAASPELSEDARERLENWRREDNEDYLSPLDVLLDELHVLHKLLRVADGERSRLWLVEVLDQERQALAAQAAYLLRNP